MTTPEPTVQPDGVDRPSAEEPQTEAGRSWVDWIDDNATDDRMLYAVVKNGPTVGDLRQLILNVEREARHVGFMDCARRSLDAIRRDRGTVGPLLTILYDPSEPPE